MEVTRGQFRAIRRMFKKFPLQFLNSLLGCSGCVGSAVVMMKQHPSCQPAWKFSVNCNPRLQKNFTVWCTIHIFTTLLKIVQQYSQRIPKHGIFPADGVTKFFGLKWTGMFPLHWSILRFGLVVTRPWFVPGNNPVNYIFFFICIT
jgi:hypothetical protein